MSDQDSVRAASNPESRVAELAESSCGGRNSEGAAPVYETGAVLLPAPGLIVALSADVHESELMPVSALVYALRVYPDGRVEPVYDGEGAEGRHFARVLLVPDLPGVHGDVTMLGGLPVYGSRAAAFEGLKRSHAAARRALARAAAAGLGFS